MLQGFCKYLVGICSKHSIQPSLFQYIQTFWQLLLVSPGSAASLLQTFSQIILFDTVQPATMLFSLLLHKV